MYTTASASAASVVTPSATAMSRVARRSVEPFMTLLDAGGDEQQQRDPDEQCDHSFGDGADASQREPAGVVGVLQVGHVAGDRVDLAGRERVGAEDRHLPWSGAQRLPHL